MRSFIGTTEAEFLEEIRTKVLRVFLLVILLYCFALRILFLKNHATSYSFCKGVKEEKLIENHAYRLTYVLIKPNRHLMSENSQDYAQKPQRNC
jgi:hypothetical protein